MPLLARQQKRKTDEIDHANAPQPQQLSEPRYRPYLLNMLQDGPGTRVLADTLDWDGEFVRSFTLTCCRPVVNLIFLFFSIIILIALAHYKLDASVLSLDNVYKGIQNDMETYYFLWVAVRKVLAEAPNVMLDLFIQNPPRACWKK
jgi:hypothetical protein